MNIDESMIILNVGLVEKGYLFFVQNKSLSFLMLITDFLADKILKYKISKYSSKSIFLIFLNIFN
jgi:hypothetical protein